MGNKAGGPGVPRWITVVVVVACGGMMVAAVVLIVQNHRLVPSQGSRIEGSRVVWERDGVTYNAPHPLPAGLPLLAEQTNGHNTFVWHYASEPDRMVAYGPTRPADTLALILLGMAIPLLCGFLGALFWRVPAVPPADSDDWST